MLSSFESGSDERLGDDAVARLEWFGPRRIFSSWHIPFRERRGLDRDLG
jgi:hypothetical protein